MALIPFPSVPKLPGVPSIPRSASFPPIVRAGLGIVQGLLWRMFQVQSKWGIFDVTGKPLGDPEKFTGILGSAAESIGLGATLSTGAVEYSKETRISDFPVERGSFASYNKVEMPSNPVVTMCFQGSESERRAFLDAIDEACKSTDIYDVITPEVQYLGYSLERYNYSRRSEKGATLLIVEITLKEIREVVSSYSASAQVKEPKDVAATPQEDTGKVQPQEREKSTLKAAEDRFVTQPDKADGTITSGLGNTYNADGTSMTDGTAGTSTRASRFAEMKF